jgi:hypothetical protein
MKYLIPSILLLASTFPVGISAVHFTVAKDDNGSIEISFSHQNLYLKGNPKGFARVGALFSVNNVNIVRVNDREVQVTVSVFNGARDEELLPFSCTLHRYSQFLKALAATASGSIYNSNSQQGKSVLSCLQKILADGRIYFDIPSISWYEWFQNRKKYILGSLFGIGTTLGLYMYRTYYQKK